jgi:hypothetical protein
MGSRASASVTAAVLIALVAGFAFLVRRAESTARADRSAPISPTFTPRPAMLAAFAVP